MVTKQGPLLDDLDEIGLVAVPDLASRPNAQQVAPSARGRRCPEPDAPAEERQPAPPALPTFEVEDIADAQLDLVGSCEALHDRIAILQHPAQRAQADEVVRWRERFDSAFGAVYWPWLQVVETAAPIDVLAVPPCGHVAGIVARTDLAIGPHQPPANVTVVGAVGLTLPVDDRTHGSLNEHNVNTIRSSSGRGIRVMGARTMSTIAAWRYLNVRRLVSQIERRVAGAAQWLVFEPNARILQEEVERVIRSLLDDIWRAGGLDGRTADEAYSVVIEPPGPGSGGDASRLIAEIGLLPPWPAEFVVVRIDVTQPDTSGRPGERGHRALNR